MNQNFQYFIFIRENRTLGQVDYGMVKNLLIVLVNSYRNSRKIAYRCAKIPNIFRVHKYLQKLNTVICENEQLCKQKNKKCVIIFL